MRRDTLQQVLVFSLLVALGVAGRWSPPQWNATPVAAAALFAGFYFAQRGVAMLVPFATLVVSNLLLPQYQSFGVMATVYGAMLLPALLGPIVRRSTTRWGMTAQAAILVVIPSTLFFILTNFAVWAFENYYPHTLAGLGQCYTAAIPFYRWMLSGDLCFTAMIFGAYAVACGLPERRDIRQLVG